MLGIISVLAVFGLTIVMGRLRQTSRELEQRVRERTAELQEANQKLSSEQIKSEGLLLNILPEPIAQRLKDGHTNIADGFAEVTILFADIVNFTELSKTISPKELVKLLNEIFTGFDQLTEKHGLEKIKTIGDAYMVVGGIPTHRSDHAEAIAEMAFDMQAEVARFNAKHNTNLSIRIGINTGPVVAGVIGTKKFIYDLWGDAVNTASRMESHGIAGSIQVTESTYHHLCDGNASQRHRYLFEERGVIQVKGKGEMIAYLLTGRLK
jgi:class 3 adenylate cyclase